MPGHRGELLLFKQHESLGHSHEHALHLLLPGHLHPGPAEQHAGSLGAVSLHTVSVSSSSLHEAGHTLYDFGRDVKLWTCLSLARSDRNSHTGLSEVVQCESGLSCIRWRTKITILLTLLSLFLVSLFRGGAISL